MIEYIKKNKIIFAQIIRSKFKSKKGVNFFTKPNLIQQVAYMNHKQGHKIIPHFFDPPPNKMWPRRTLFDALHVPPNFFGLGSRLCRGDQTTTVRIPRACA